MLPSAIYVQGRAIVQMRMQLFTGYLGTVNPLHARRRLAALDCLVHLIGTASIVHPSRELAHEVRGLPQQPRAPRSTVH